MSKYKTAHYVKKKKFRDPIIFVNEISINKEISSDLRTFCHNSIEHNPILEQIYGLRWILMMRYRRNFYKHLEKAWAQL